jgi:hypothetical protein
VKLGRGECAGGLPLLDLLLQRTERERESPLASTSYDEGPQVTALIVYTARYYSGMPFQDPVPVLIKEYLPEARPAAQNELRVSPPPPLPSLSCFPTSNYHHTALCYCDQGCDPGELDCR